MTGPLKGVRVVEIAGVGPLPFGAMLLADMGASIIRIERPDAIKEPLPFAPTIELLSRGRHSISIDLKTEAGRAGAFELINSADALIEGFRPGVMERLGLGPDECLAARPSLVYGRMTGWGQTGPFAHKAGHDINYIGAAGVLDEIGTQETPVIPLNLVGDFGGGGTFLALGVLAGIIHARATGEGQVVDASILDGTAMLTTDLYSFGHSGMWDPLRARNLLDGGAHFYNVYRCSDGDWIAVGAVEQKFYSAFLTGIGHLDDPVFVAGWGDRTLWPELRDAVAEIIAMKTRDEWLDLYETLDACVTPVLTRANLGSWPHNRVRKVLSELDGMQVPTAAPRFSKTAATAKASPPKSLTTVDILAEWQRDITEAG